MTLRLATICSGIGAPECAADVIGGFEHVFVSEIEDFPSAVLAHHFPTVPNLGDFTKIGEDWNGKVDVLVGGTPCQSFSVAGKRLGLDDPRGNLTLEFLRLVGRIRPRWVVWENVPGVLSDDGGRTFDQVCRTLRDEFGFEVVARVLDAVGFGVPQRRRRVFVVGGPRGGSVFALRRDEDRRAWRAAARFATWDGGMAEDAGDLPFRAGGDGGDDVRGSGGIGTPVTIDERKPMVLYATGKRDGISIDTVAQAFPAQATGNTKPMILAFDSKRTPAPSDLSPTLRATPHAGSHMNGGGGIAVVYAEAIADPLSANEGRTYCNAGNNPRLRNVIAYVRENNLRLRRLTPMETERLQGFPDDWTLIPWRGKLAPDSRRYKAIGNSMAVPVLAWILEGIRDFEG